MADPNTIRVLSFDGGGARGYLSLSWFQRFINQWGISPSAVAANFDVIMGTSVGGMMGLSLAFGLTPDDDPETGMFKFFIEDAPYIFSLSSLIPSWRPNSLTKGALILADIPFYQSSGPTADSYGYGLLVNRLQTTFGSSTLQNLNTNVIIPSYRQDTKSYVLFSNVTNGRFVGPNSLISDVALATGSPPVYMPSWTFGGHTYIDGGVYQNNPANFGVVLGKMLKPNAKRICLLSIGTGRGELGFDPEGSNGIPLANNPLATISGSSTVTVTVPTTSILTEGQNVTLSGAVDTGGIAAVNLNITASISIINSTSFYYTAGDIASSTTTGGGATVVMDYIAPVTSLLSADALAFNTIEQMFGLFEIAQIGGQESVAETFLLQSLYTLDQFYYYRFNPILDPTKNTELDNTDPEIYTYYSELAETLFNEDNINISNFIGHLTA